MKNTTFKNLILLSVFAVFLAGFNYTFAADLGYRASMIDTSTLTPLSYSNSFAQQQPYVYLAPQVKTVAQPVSPSVSNTTNTTKTNTLAQANTNNSGKYVNYDNNSNSSNSNMGASAYSSQSGSNNSNSGSFMPNTIAQWFVLILLIFAIVILARILMKKKPTANDIHAAHHA